jgi:hypothetical protein
MAYFVKLLEQISARLRIKWREMRHEGFTSRLLFAGAIPTVIGVMGDVGSFASGLALVGGLILTGFVLTLYLKLPDSRNLLDVPDLL